jgi:hypothetical protein
MHRENVTGMGKQKIRTEFLLGNLKGSDNLGDLATNGKVRTQ